MSGKSKTVFVTVGSTRFDVLVDRVLSEDVVVVLKQHGFTGLVVQAGSSPVNLSSDFKIDENAFRTSLNDVVVDVWRYKPSLKEEYEKAELVIGHAGMYYHYMI